MGDSTASVIDPSNGSVIDTISLGANALPYNYSDMTGFNNQVVNPGGCPLRGYWTVIEDGHWANALWRSVAWTAVGTVEVWIRADDDRLALSCKPFARALNAATLSGVRGRYAEIRASLTRNSCGEDPFIENVTVCRQSPTLTLPHPLEDKFATEGTDAELRVQAVGADPLNYQWYRAGQTIPGAIRSFLEFKPAGESDHAEYTVQIVDGVGETATSKVFLTVVPPNAVRVPAVPGDTVSSVYPLQKSVSGQPNTVASVQVVLRGLTHDRPDDLDLLLVSPTGRRIMLMSDAGGIVPVNRTEITFDAAYAPPEDDGPLGGPYVGACNFGEQEETFPAALGGVDPPPGPYLDTLGGLTNTNPNGVWRLYIVDDTPGRLGFITEWDLLFN